MVKVWWWIFKLLDPLMEICCFTNKVVCFRSCHFLKLFYTSTFLIHQVVWSFTVTFREFFSHFLFCFCHHIGFYNNLLYLLINPRVIKLCFNYFYYRRERFSREFKFIFSCVKTDAKIRFQILWLRYAKFVVIFETSVHLHGTDVSDKHFYSFSSDLHFSLPYIQGTCFIFSRIKSKQHLSFTDCNFAQVLHSQLSDFGI